MIPNLIVPVLNRPDLLERMLDSIDHPVGQVIIIDNGAVVPWEMWEETPHRVIEAGHNLGVAASWNLGMKVSPAGWWLIVNSDIVFGRGDLERLAKKVTRAPGLWCMKDMAAFALTLETLDAVGTFDENFHPAYDEDLDYARRAQLARVPIIKTGFTGEHEGSATIRADHRFTVRNAYTHPMNDQYYARKWGGRKLGGETFDTPFNLGGSVRDWTLEPRRLVDQDWG